MSLYTTNVSEIARYLSDESSAFAGSADRLYTPANANEIATVLRQATEEATGVTVSGAGSSKETVVVGLNGLGNTETSAGTGGACPSLV